MEIQLISTSKEYTKDVAQAIAPFLRRGSVITLDGDLGAGKTTFTQGLGKGLNIKNSINSPTFNILKCYFDGILPLYHIDAYRLEDQINNQIGLEEVIQGDGICVIEWSCFIKELVYKPLEIVIERINDDKRLLTFKTSEKKYEEVFKKLEDFKNV